jgi:aminoglycoside 6'-N-acetyltransferase I
MLIRPIEPRDAFTWERLRSALWPVEAWTHAPEIAAFFAGTAAEPQAVLVAEDDTGTIIAVAELSIRRDILGLEGQPTGYVEGLYVLPAHRGRGVARALLMASRDWARMQRCVAFASDRADRIIVDPKFGKTNPGEEVENSES